MVARTALVPALIAAGCSLWVDPDESRLEPSDGGTEWCEGPLELAVDFPKADSAVLGVFPVRIRASHCSGIDRVEGATSDLRIGRAIGDGDRFVLFWDTSDLAGGRRTLQLSATAHRPGTTANRSLDVVVLRFEPELVPGPPGLGMGVSVLDFDGDGRDDMLWGGGLWLAREEGAGVVTVDGTVEAFADWCATTAPGERCGVGTSDGIPLLNEPAAADVTGDGVPDILSMVGSDGRLHLLVGHRPAPGRYVIDPAASRILASEMGRQHALAADFDLDGDLDVLVVRACVHVGTAGCSVSAGLPHLLLRQGDAGEFERVPAWQVGLPPVLWDETAAVGDLDADRHPDLVLARGLGGPARVFRNRLGELEPAGYPWFEDVTPPGLPSGGAVGLWDFDGDGRIDIAFPVAADFGGDPPSLWRNLGDMQFLNVTLRTGYPGGLLFDVNNDGFLDAGGMLGAGDGTFVSTGLSFPGIPLDLDGNGTMDLFTNPGTAYRNRQAGTGAIVVRVALRDGRNRHGSGARVRLLRPGDDPDSPALPTRVVELGQGWAGSGLGYRVRFGVEPDAFYDVEVALTDQARPILCPSVEEGMLLTIAGRDASGCIASPLSR
jgi:hypothetical protein